MPKKIIPIFTLSLAAQLGVASAQTAPAAVTRMEGVVVTASPLGRTLFEQAQPVSILSGDELKLRLAPTLGDTLASQPGVTSTHYAPGVSRPVIRGLDADRIRILQNGSNTLDASSTSPDHAVSFDPSTVERIEVVRGPATLLYGPNAVGGVVNVIDNRIPDERLSGPWPVRGSLDGRIGSVDDELAGAGIIEFGIGGLVIHLDGSKRNADDIHIPDYARSARIRRLEPLPPGEKETRHTLPNSFSQSESGAAGASYVWDEGYAGLSYSGYNANYGIVAEPGVTAQDYQRRFDARAAFFTPFTGMKSVKLNFSISDYEHTELEGPLVGTVFENEGYDGRIDVVHEKIGPLEGAFGFETQKSDFSALGDEAFLPPVRTVQHSGFLFEEIDLTPVRLQFGVRFDHTTLDKDRTSQFGPSQSREFNAFSGSIGAIHTPVEGYAVAFSASYTQRPPTYYELFANGPHLATAAFETGDPSLGLEQALNFDLALRKQTGRVTGSIGVFYTRFTDFIVAQNTGETVPFGEGDESEDLPVFRFSAVPANFMGAELEMTFHLIQPPTSEPAVNGKDAGKDVVLLQPAYVQSLDLELKADYVYAENRETHEPIPRIPTFRSSAGLIYRWDRFTARLEGQYAARQNRTASFELPTDSYFLLNASVEYAVPIRQAELNFYVRGTNLTNEDARLHTSFLKEISPLPGAGVLFGLKATF